jgi:hypothetical protein
MDTAQSRVAVTPLFMRVFTPDTGEAGLDFLFHASGHFPVFGNQ